MKKLLTIIAITALAFVAQETQAQSRPERIVKVSTDTSSNADTVIVALTGVGSNVTGYQVSINRLSGTAAGIVLLQGSIDGSQWVNVNTDTLTLTNVAAQSKLWPISRTNYYSYRAWYKTTGTQTSTISFSQMRRPDEN